MNSETQSKHYEKIALGESSFGGDFLKSQNKEFILFKPSISKKLFLIHKEKVLWEKEIENLVSFDFAKKGIYVVAVAQLTNKEMPKGYKSGGHIYIISKDGKLKDIKIPCDGLSCSISPKEKTFGITTMGPEWGVYYLDNKGNILWNKKFDKRIGGIEVKDNKIILYDKIHKETRKKVLELDLNGSFL